MKTVKKALYVKVTGDATLMTRLGQQGFYQGRLPDTAVVSKTVASLVLDGSTDVPGGDKEDQTFSFSIYSLSHDLVEDVAGDLKRLFHSTKKRWLPLTIPEGDRALVRMEAEFDVPDPASEWVHKAMRFRVKFAQL